MGCFLCTLIKRLIALIQVVLSRLIFAGFSFYLVFRVDGLKILKNNHALILLVPLLLLALETLHLMCCTCFGKKKQSKKRFTFFFSIFLYLCCTVPGIWIIQVMECHDSAEFCKKGSVQRNNAIKELQQLLVFFLVFGKWIEPSGKVSDEKISQMLLSALGSGADIVDIISSIIALQIDLNQGSTRQNSTSTPSNFQQIVDYSVLTVWTLSMLQYTFVLQSSENSKKSQKNDQGENKEQVKEERGFIDFLSNKPLVLRQLINTTIQDIPFLAIRSYVLVISSKIYADTLFFLSKNILVILLTLFRIRKQYKCYKKQPKQGSKNNQKSAKGKADDVEQAEREDPDEEEEDGENDSE